MAKKPRSPFGTRHQRPLSVDLAIGMVVILALIEGGLLYFMYHRQARIMQKEMSLNADDHAAKLSEVLAVPMWDFDDEQIGKIGKGFLQNDLVCRLRITGNQGNEILVLENDLGEGPFFSRTSAILYNEQIIGQVEIVLSAASYFQELDWLRNTLIIVFFGSIAVFFIASGILLRFLLRQPLAALAQGMDRIARGEFDHQTHNLSYTELAGIAERFSRMASRIKARENAMIDINRELQQVNAQLHRRFQYEQLLADMSTQAASQIDFDRFMDKSLHLLGETMGSVWIGLYQYSPESEPLALMTEWSRGDACGGALRLTKADGDWVAELLDALRDNRVFQKNLGRVPARTINSGAPLPEAVQCLVAFPLVLQQAFYGAILFGNTNETWEWEDTRPVLETAVQIVIRFIESHRARKLLLSSEERFREMAELLPETIFEMDCDGRLTYVNKNGLEQFGYSLRDLDNGLNAYDMFMEEDRPNLGKDIQAILNGRPSRLKEYRGLHANGASFPTMISSSLIRKDDRIVGVRGFVINVSEKKDLEERLRKANRMEAIGNLAAGVAHDLNNILSGLVGYPDLLLLDLPDDSPMRTPVNAIRETGLKAAAVVQDLLTLARRNIEDSQIINLNSVVADYLNAPEYLQLKERHDEVNLSMTLADDLMNIQVSPHHIAKSFMNLVVNAMEAMPAGGALKIMTANRYVDQDFLGYESIPEGEYAVLSVVDAGIGISPQDVKNIFEPFYTKKRMGRSGTGLGMSVVWATVKDHGGFIDLQSQEGRGTRFDLYFPATRVKIVPQPKHIPIEDYLGNEHILVVDDMPEQRRIAADMLGRLGYTVHTISNGESAVEFIQQQTVDLVVLDMVMDPGIDGLETYQRMLSHVPGQKAIIASGFAETVRVKKARQLGACSYLKKPYTLEKLGVSVRAALDQCESPPA